MHSVGDDSRTTPERPTPRIFIVTYSGLFSNSPIRFHHLRRIHFVLFIIHDGPGFVQCPSQLPDCQNVILEILQALLAHRLLDIPRRVPEVVLGAHLFPPETFPERLFRRSANFNPSDLCVGLLNQHVISKLAKLPQNLNGFRENLGARHLRFIFQNDLNGFHYFPQQKRDRIVPTTGLTSSTVFCTASITSSTSSRISSTFSGIELKIFLVFSTSLILYWCLDF